MPSVEQLTSGGAAGVVCVIAYIAVNALARRGRNGTSCVPNEDFSGRLDRLETDLREGLKGVHSRLDTLWQHLSQKK